MCQRTHRQKGKEAVSWSRLRVAENPRSCPAADAAVPTAGRRRQSGLRRKSIKGFELIDRCMSSGRHHEMLCPSVQPPNRTTAKPLLTAEDQQAQQRRTLGSRHFWWEDGELGVDGAAAGARRNGGPGLAIQQAPTVKMRLSCARSALCCSPAPAINSLLLHAPEPCCAGRAALQISFQRPLERRCCA